jgi:hypothetical protein
MGSIPQVIGLLQFLRDPGIEAFPDFFAKLLPRIARQERIERCGETIDSLAAPARHIKKVSLQAVTISAPDSSCPTTATLATIPPTNSWIRLYQSAIMPLREKLLCLPLDQFANRALSPKDSAKPERDVDVKILGSSAQA